MSQAPTLAQRLYAQRWALAAPLILGLMLLGLGAMTRLAMDDPGFALESQYYTKALHWDEHRAELTESRRLGWKSHLAWSGDHFELELKDRAGAPIRDATLTLTAFPVARSAAPEQLRAQALGDGRYQATPARPRPGLWELRLVAERGAQRFLETQRLQLPPGAGR